MCNAWNHPQGCTCGWGGEGHLGRRSSGNGATGSSGYWWVPPITHTLTSYVNPNAACPLCGAPVYFYLSPNGGRVFFDELGPPWPKHPCTDNRSVPKQLIATPNTEKSYKWQVNGWEPFFITEISNLYKYVLELKGEYKDRQIKLYVRRNAHGAVDYINKQCIAYLRKIDDSSFDLSLITPTGTPISITAFLTLMRASKTSRVVRREDALRKITTIRRVTKAKLKKIKKPVLPEIKGALALALEKAKKKG